MRTIDRGMWFPVQRRAATALLCLFVAGCDLLPSDGPNANGVLGQASANIPANSATVTRFAIVGLDARIARDAEEFYQPSVASLPETFRKTGTFGSVGIGDLLRVTIWDNATPGLFGSDGKGNDVTVRVDVDGRIVLPYVNDSNGAPNVAPARIIVSGKRPSEIEEAIRSKLVGATTNPQVTVTIAENVSNSVSVQGDVLKSGPYPVQTTNQRVLDMIAMAGGSKYPPYETTVRLTRGRGVMTATLQEVVDQPDIFNVSVAAGDALLLIRKPNKFLAFGAVLQPGDQVFRKASPNLSDGLGQVLGLSAERSDAKGVFLFRREPVALARRYGVQLLPEDHDTVPIVYQVNLKDPKSFFVMNDFPMKPNDILYVSPAPLAETARFFQILSGATASVAIPRTLLGNYPTGQ